MLWRQADMQELKRDLQEMASAFRSLTRLSAATTGIAESKAIEAVKDAKNKRFMVPSSPQE